MNSNWPWDSHKSKEHQGKCDANASRPMKTENELTGLDRADTYSSYVNGYKSIVNQP